MTRASAISAFIAGVSAWCLAASQASAVGGQDCGGCGAPDPSCGQLWTSGTDGCGNSCSRGFDNYCDAPSPACEQTTTGSYVCGGTCTRTGGSCSSSSPPPDPWQPYGFAFPGDPVYGFDYQPNSERDMLGLAAKGNIVLGDYTWDGDGDGMTDFEERGVLEMLQPNTADNPDGKTQPYAVDQSDAALGYGSYWIQGRPYFDGDYTQVDKNGQGEKADGTPRRFYESSLPDAQFQALVEPSWRSDPNEPQPYHGFVDAVLYTNHALAGLTPHYGFTFFGSLVARDDAMVRTGTYTDMHHDVRLLGDEMASQTVLPLDIHRPRLKRWEELPPLP